MYKAKRGLLFKISIAILLVCLLCSTLFLIDAHKVKASAEANTLLINAPTFIDVRKKTANSVSFNEFVNEEFQLNDANFDYIRASEIENLIDPRHNISLGTQAEAVRVNRYADITNGDARQ